MRRIEKWRRLASWERRLLLQLVFLLPAVGAAVHIMPYKRVVDLLQRLAQPPRIPVPDLCPTARAETAERIARLVAIAAHYGPYRATCLRQSLSLWWLLLRRGIPAEIRIGVRKEGQELHAHAWVEHAGRALSDDRGTTAAYAALSCAKAFAQP
jgi:hypothetical protein